MPYTALCGVFTLEVTKSGGQFHGTSEIARFFEGFLVLIGEGVPVELQETLFMLSGGRNGFQSAFLVRSCDGFEILVLGILSPKGLLGL